MDDTLFEFDAPKTFTNLYEVANSNDDGADRFFGNLMSNYLSCRLF